MIFERNAYLVKKKKKNGKIIRDSFRLLEFGVQWTPWS